jgi:hypothetical protein
LLARYCRIAKSGRNRPADVQALVAAAGSGDEHARYVITCAGWAVGLALSNLFYCADPESVVVRGGHLTTSDLFRGAVSSAVEKAVCFKGKQAAERIHYRPSAVGDRARGAAAAALHHFLESDERISGAVDFLRSNSHTDVIARQTGVDSNGRQQAGHAGDEPLVGSPPLLAMLRSQRQAAVELRIRLCASGARSSRDRGYRI